MRWLKVDWNKWKDEDEIDENDLGFDMGGMENFDMSSLGNMGLGEGGEGEGEDDSDEEEGNIFYSIFCIIFYWIYENQSFICIYIHISSPFYLPFMYNIGLPDLETEGSKEKEDEEDENKKKAEQP